MPCDEITLALEKKVIFSSGNVRVLAALEGSVLPARPVVRSRKTKLHRVRDGNSLVAARRPLPDAVDPLEQRHVRTTALPSSRHSRCSSVHRRK